MKRWAIITVGMYVLVLLVLTIPLMLIGWLKWGIGSAGGGRALVWDMPPGEAIKIFAE